jgi:hypothetical protein
MSRSNIRCVCVLYTSALLCTATSLAAQTGPAPTVTHFPADVIALACAPTLAFERPLASLLITGGQDASTRHGFAAGDLITINGGSDNGIEVGQEYYVRRVQAPRGTGMSRATPATIRTAGWVRVYAVDNTMSLVTVSHACDTIDVGDYLEPFSAPEPPTADPNPAKPQKDNYGHLLMGADRRTMFARNDFVTIDRGSDHGVTLGERFMVFRDKRRMETRRSYAIKELPDAIVTPEFLFEIGEAVVVDVKPEVSTVQVLNARSALLSGDYVALRK